MLRLITVILLTCIIHLAPLFTFYALAGTIQLPRTGQATCYDAVGAEITCTGTGQDGELQKGIAWPNPRFRDNGNGTITDNLTSLMWAKDGSTPTSGACTGGRKIWQGALDYVSCLNGVGYKGYNDWRLPNANELLSLANDGGNGWLNSRGFIKMNDYYYWSSDTSY